MIEIIQEEDRDSNTKALPKDIKQIGRPDIGDRIYVENQVYQFLHPYDSQEEKTAYVLLGRFENYAGRECTFVEAAIRLEEMDFDGELPMWNDHTWAYIYKQLKHEYDSMVIVGWALDIKGQLPNLTARMEALHQNNFGGVHQILFLLDTLECEEAFYGSRNGLLYRREGFYIYYDKKISDNLNRVVHTLEKEHTEKAVEKVPQEEEFGKASLTDDNFDKAHLYQEMRTSVDEITGRFDRNYQYQESEPDAESNADRFAMEGLGETDEFEKKDAREIFNEIENRDAADRGGRYEKILSGRKNDKQGSYRKQVLEQEEKPLIPSYASSFLLLTVVCVLGATAYINYQKMNAMEATIAQINGSQSVTVEQTEETDSEEVKVEPVAGTVEKLENVQESQAAVDGAAETPEATGETPAVPVVETEAAAQGTETQGTETAATDAAADAAAQQAETAETTGTAPAPDPVVSEAQAYLNQGYYIVQKGDSLVGICRKIYQTTAMMDKLCEVNGIEDQDSIYAGQYLTLPN